MTTILASSLRYLCFLGCVLSTTAICISTPQVLATSTWRVIADARAQNAVWMASATEGWAVGDSGLLVHTTDGGATWTEQSSSTTVNLNGVWGASVNDVWAVGDGGTILKYNGSVWAAQTSGVTVNLQAVHGLSTTSVWAVGASANALIWNGTTWTKQNTPNPGNYVLYGVWAANPTSIWAVGAGGKIIKNNGTTWSNHTSGVTVDLFAVWGTSTTNVLAVGETGSVRSFVSGSTWGAGPSSGVTTSLRSIAGADATHVWIAGDSGAVGFYNGSGAFAAQTSNASQAINGLAAISSSVVVAVGGRKLVDRFDGTTWTAQAAQTPTSAFNAVWGSDDNDVWFASPSGNAYRYNGSTFSQTNTGVSGSLNDIWGSDSGNVWAVGAGGAIVRRVSNAWVAQVSGSTQALNGVHGTSTSDVWAVGASGTILHFDGSSWTAKTSGTTQNLNAVWAASPTVVWAVGAGGTILKYNGSTWAAQSSGVTVALNEVEGASSASVWAVGASGTVLKSTGSTWSAQTSGTTTALTSLAVVSTTHQWAAGGTTLLHGTGSAWAADGSTGYAATISAAWASSASTVFLAASSGMVFVNSPIDVPEITLEQPASTLIANRSTVDFGAVIVPANSVKTFTLRSVGNFPLTGLSLAVTGAAAADFAVTTLASSVLAQGTSTTFDVTFTPSVAGTRTALLTVISNDLDEPAYTLTLTGLGQVGVSITTQPVAKTVNPNAAVSLICGVNANATQPVSYQWQMFNTSNSMWENISGAIKSTYSIAHAIESNDGSYQCLVSNGVTSPTSDTVTISVNDPVVITAAPVAATAGTGTDVTLTVVATGTETKKYVWRRNGIAIASAPNAASYPISNIQLAQGGDYSVVVSNMVNTQTSVIAKVLVIDTTVQTVFYPTLGKAILTAKYTGLPTSYHWQKGGSDIADFRYTAKNNVLAISTLQVTPTTDTGTYTCIITGPTGAPVTSTINLVVYNAPPSITGAEPLAMPDAMVGDPTYSYPIPFDADPLLTPTYFSATPLPTGLTCNPATGVITGRPAVAITADKLYLVTLTAGNAKSKSVKKANLTLHPLSPAAVGVFNGPVTRHSILNNNLGGRFDLTMTTSGSFSGKLLLGALTYSFKSTLISDNTGLVAPHASFIIKRKPPTLPDLTVTFSVDLANHTLTSCDISSTAGKVGFAAGHQRLGTTMSQTDSDDLKTYAGYYTFSIDPAVPTVIAPLTPAEVQPQGHGYGSFTIASSGLLTVSGKLPDGTAYTTATFAGPHGEVMLYKALYSNLGSVTGSLDITQGTAGFAPAYGDNTLSEVELSWLRPSILGTNHLYRSGFGPIDCTVVGGRYVVPTSPALLFDVVDNGSTDNSHLVFTDGGIQGTSTDVIGTQVSPDIDVRIKAGGLVVVPLHTVIPPDHNPRSTTLSIKQSTGLFSGKATLVDTNPALAGGPVTGNVTRALTYYGIIHRDGSVMRGRGYFHLARRPDFTTQTVLTTDRLSGEVVLEKK